MAVSVAKGPSANEVREVIPGAAEVMSDESREVTTELAKVDVEAKTGTEPMLAGFGCSLNGRPW